MTERRRTTDKHTALLALFLACALALGACATGEATLAIQRAARSKSSPGVIRFALTFTAGQVEQTGSESRLEGEVIEDVENRLTLLRTEVIDRDETLQTVDMYLYRGGEYQPTLYRGVDSSWIAQRVSRSYANQWRDSLSFSLTQDLLKALRSPVLEDSAATVNGVTCHRISANLPADKVASLLQQSMFPTFFGFPSLANDSTFYDGVEDVTATAYVGRDDGRVVRLELDLSAALKPLVERTSNTSGNSSNELWQDLRLGNCTLTTDYGEYDAPRTIALPSEARAVEPTS